MPLVPVAVSGFLLSAMTSLRLQGALPSPPEGTLAGGVVALYRLFGFEPLFMVCVLLLTWSSIWFLTGRVERPLSRLARIGALGLSLAILVNLRIDGVLPPGGGELGALLATRLASVISPAVSIFALAVVAVAALLLATDFFFYGYFERLGARRVRARELDAPEPRVDVREQAEFESLALSSPSTDAVSGAAATAVPLSEPSSAAESGPAATAEHPDVDLAATDEGAVAEFELTDDEVWALEEDLSSVTLLGPRRVDDEPADDEPADVVAAEVENEPEAASAEASASVGSTELFDELSDHRPMEGASDALGADHVTASAEGPPSEEELPVAPQGAVVREEEAAPAVLEAGSAAADDLADDDLAVDEFEPAADGPTAFDEPAASGAADHEVAEAGQDLPDLGQEPAHEPRPSLEVESTAAVLAQDAIDLDVGTAESGAHALSDSADERVAAELDEPVVELTPAPRVIRQQPDHVGLGQDLVAEAVKLVVAYRRASANFLKRRLRVEDDQAMALLQVLAARGIIECEAGATQGRILGG